MIFVFKFHPSIAKTSPQEIVIMESDILVNSVKRGEIDWLSVGQVCKNRYTGDLGVMPLEFHKDSLSFSQRKKNQTFRGHPRNWKRHMISRTGKHQKLHNLSMTSPGGEQRKANQEIIGRERKKKVLSIWFLFSWPI